MDILIRTHPAPAIPDHIQESLDDMYPRVFLRWNARHGKPTREVDDRPVWDEPRWEIWVELKSVSHPGAKNIRQKTDLWNTDAQCWMRRLQTYENADGSFAPADERLIVGLQMADTWANRRFYEDHVEAPYIAAETAEMKRRQEIYEGAAEYYAHHDRLVVAPYSKGGTADWRWRTR